MKQMGDSRHNEVMPKEISGLNTFWLLEYLQEHWPDLNIENLIEKIRGRFPCFVKNLQTGNVEQVTITHLKNPRYWFSHQFIQALHELIQEHIPDPRLGFKIANTIYKTQPILKTTLAIPFLGTHGVARRVSKEAAKFNRTKQYLIQDLQKGLIKIRVTHNPGIVASEFTMQWNAGCFASYAKMAGATDIDVTLCCIDAETDESEKLKGSTWDFEIRYQEPGRLARLTKSLLINIPLIKRLTERAEAIEDELQEQILNRDNIIRKRTAELAQTNKAMALEITERKEVEKTLRQTQMQLQRYIASIDDIGLGLCVINEDYTINAVNSTLTSWFGDFHDKYCYSVLMDQDEPCNHCKLRDVLTKGEKIRYTPTISNGRTLEIVATPIANGDGTVSNMAIFHDITEQRIKEKQRLKFSQQKEQLKKLASLKTMAGAIAHRFNNAMTGVQSNLELMTVRLPEESKEFQMASHALEASRGASQIGTMMVSYLGQNPLQLEQVALADFVLEYLKEWEQGFKETEIAVESTPPGSPIYCSIDPPHIREVLQNLLNNAVESFQGNPGKIEISFGKEHVTPESLPLFFQRPNLSGGSYAFCEIKDTGHGLSAEQIEHIFDPFYTTRSTGRGLGLAFAGGILLAHQGALSISSRPDNGATVRVLFPAVPATVQAIEEPSPENKGESVSFSGDILLVDDEPLIVIALKIMLQDMGFTVHTARNGHKAVKKIFDGDIPYCAVLMDILMPKIGGIEAMEKIRRIRPTLPIVLMSGYLKDEFCFMGTQPDALLMKPINNSSLKKELHRLLSTQVLAADSVSP